MHSDTDAVNSERPPMALPATIPSLGLVIQRTNWTLGLLKDIIGESTAEYWYKRGKESITLELWGKANYEFARCIKLDAAHWQGALQLSVVLVKNGQDSEAIDILDRIYTNPIMAWQSFSEELDKAQWMTLYHIRASTKTLNGHLNRALIHKVLGHTDFSGGELELYNHDAIMESCLARRVTDSGYEKSALWNFLSEGVG